MIEIESWLLKRSIPVSKILAVDGCWFGPIDSCLSITFWCLLMINSDARGWSCTRFPHIPGEFREIPGKKSNNNDDDDDNNKISPEQFTLW